MANSQRPNVPTGASDTKAGAPDAPGAPGSAAPLASMLRASGPESHRSCDQWPSPGGGPTCQHRGVDQQTQGARPTWQKETVRWPGVSVRPGGGDAYPAATLECSRAAGGGGLDFPLRRLTAIHDRRSWRRGTPAGPTTTDDPISRRSAAVGASSTRSRTPVKVLGKASCGTRSADASPLRARTTCPGPDRLAGLTTTQGRSGHAVQAQRR